MTDKRDPMEIAKAAREDADVAEANRSQTHHDECWREHGECAKITLAMIEQVLKIMVQRQP